MSSRRVQTGRPGRTNVTKQPYFVHRQGASCVRDTAVCVAKVRNVSRVGSQIISAQTFRPRWLTEACSVSPPHIPFVSGTYENTWTIAVSPGRKMENQIPSIQAVAAAHLQLHSPVLRPLRSLFNSAVHLGARNCIYSKFVDPRSDVADEVI